jgi:hypothetical protein
LDKVKEAASVSRYGADYFYNLGNIACMKKDWGAAVEAYRQSLLRNPGDMDAKENYAYAKQMLKNQGGGGGGQQDQQNQQNQDQQQQQQDQQQQNQDQQQSEGEDDKNKDEPDEGDQQDTEDQEVEAVLKKAQERSDEHEAEKKARMRKAPLPPNERDW